MGNGKKIRLERNTWEQPSERLVGASSRGGKKRKTITPEIAEEMQRLYAQNVSCRDIGAALGFSTAGVFKALRRAGTQTRTVQEVGAIHGPKRAGGAHWTQRNPPPCDPDTYKSVRVVDDDGKTHKRRRHVIVTEKIIGRRLYAHECVHHIDGDKHNNAPSNLQLMTRSEHARLEAILAHEKFPDKYKRRIDPKTGRFLKDKH